MEFKAKRRTLRVNIDDTIHEVRFPRMGELDAYREKIEGKSDEEKGKALADFLADSGLPVQAQEQLEPADFKEIVQLLTDQKKP